MRKFLLVCVSSAALAACSMIPDYQRPALPVTGHYPSGPAFTGRGSAASGPVGAPAASFGWRDFFLDPVLQDLIALSLENNRDLRVALLNVSAAEAHYRSQHASLFPTIDATGGAEYERLPPGTGGTPYALHVNTYSLGLSAASYELDLFGRIRSLSKQAQEQYLSSAETRLSTQISLVAQIASSYLSWLADRDAIRVSAQTAQADERSYALRKLTMERGSGTALDVAQAESTLRTAQASLEQYTRAAAQDMDEIVLLAGATLPAALQARMEAQTGLASSSAVPVLSAGLPSDLLERRPDILAAEHNLLATNANIGAARAAFFPSITLTGSGGTQSGQLGKLFGAGTVSWLFQPQVSVPIFDAGANFANLDYAKVEKRVEIANYEKAIQSAFHDVADALAARATYVRQVDAQRKLVAADQRYYDLSKMRFDAGADSYLNVLVAQSSLFGAQITLVTLELSERQNLVSLFKALGGGWEEHGH
jgi:multidrug efflux system outer membrane protein